MSLTEKFTLFVAVLVGSGAVGAVAMMYVEMVKASVHKGVKSWRATRKLYALKITFDDGTTTITQGGKQSLSLWYVTPEVKSVEIIASLNNKHSTVR